MTARSLLGSLLVAAVGLGGCGSDTTSPDSSAQLMSIAGDGQQDTIGVALDLPLTVQATSSDGSAAAGVAVEFTVVAGDVRLSASSVDTDSRGEAGTEVTLGTEAGPAEVIARIAGSTASGAEASFALEVLPGAPVDVSRVQDVPERWFAENRLLTQPSVRVTDRAGNPVAGLSTEAEWTVLEGGGTVGPFEAEPGVLEASWTLGPDLGPNRLQVTLVGQTVEFTTTAVESARIAFTSDRANGNLWDIFTMDPDGTDVVQVTSTDHRDKDLDWSPDRTRIVFARVLEGNIEGGMRSVDVATGEETGLQSGNVGGPAWSPDGRTIVYFTKGGAEGCTRAVHNLWLLDLGADGTGLRQLTEDPCAQGNKWPEWSPDGTRIVYDSRKDSEGPNDWHVWIMNADGSDARRITESKGEYAHWSPDGTTIGYGQFGASGGLWVVNADGTGERIVWQPDMEGVTYVLPGGFSPDGSFAVVEVGLEGEGPESEIFIVDIEAGEGWNLTNRRHDFDGFPAW